MQGIAQLYGRLGPGHGDQYVSELLRRTYDGLREASARFEYAKNHYVPDHVSAYSAPFPHMTLLHADWLAVTYWEMAVAFLDASVVAWQAADQLPQSVYEYGDNLCDQGSAFDLAAIRLTSEYEAKGKIVMSPLASLLDMPVTPGEVDGLWAACLAVVERVSKDMRLNADKSVPRRMQGVHQELERSLKPHFDIVPMLKRQWSATTMSDNKRHIAGELYKHVRDMFEIGQKLWAPYMIGRDYNEALKRQTTLAELSEELDPWILTDPSKRKELEGKSETASQLVKFWESLHSRGEVVALANEVRCALDSKHLRRRGNRGYPSVPWASQYLVRKPIAFGTRTFETGHLCTFYITQNEDGESVVEVRRSGKLTSILDLLGAYGTP